MAKASLLSDIHELLDEAEKSNGIEKSSADLMNLTLSYFLDYGKIKSRKFRKDSSPFDVREAVKSVMDI